MKICNSRKFVFCINHYTQTIIISYRGSIFDRQILRHEDWLPEVIECNSKELMYNIRLYRKKNLDVFIAKRT